MNKENEFDYGTNPYSVKTPKKENEFNLSEKREKLDKKGRWESYSPIDLYFYNEKDVKEFIRRLKIKIKSKVPYERWAIVGLEIDKLSGKKLI